MSLCSGYSCQPGVHVYLKQQVSPGEFSVHLLRADEWPFRAEPRLHLGQAPTKHLREKMAMVCTKDIFPPAIVPQF